MTGPSLLFVTQRHTYDLFIHNDALNVKSKQDGKEGGS